MYLALSPLYWSHLQWIGDLCLVYFLPTAVPAPLQVRSGLLISIFPDIVCWLPTFSSLPSSRSQNTFVYPFFNSSTSCLTFVLNVHRLPSTCTYIDSPSNPSCPLVNSSPSSSEHHSFSAHNMTQHPANGHSHSNGSSSSSSPLYTVPPGHLLLHLSAGKTAAFSLPSYPAASFYLYVPSSHPVSRRKRGESSTAPRQNGHANGHAEKRYPLVVCMHGSSRDAEGVRNRWADLAEREGFVVLAPLFPVDMDVSHPNPNFQRVSVSDVWDRRSMACTTTSWYDTHCVATTKARGYNVPASTTSCSR